MIISIGSCTVAAFCSAMIAMVLRLREKKALTKRKKELYDEQSILLKNYRKRMIGQQPFDNDRILPGRGKTHTLSVIAEVIDNKCQTLPVITQVGDIFS